MYFLFDSLIPHLVVLLTAFYFYKMIHCFVATKNTLFFKLLLYFLSIALTSTPIYAGDPTNIIGLLVIFLLISLTALQGNLLQRISPLFILYPLVVSINFLMDDYGIYLWTSLGADYAQGLLIRVVFLIVRLLLWLAILTFFQRYIVENQLLDTPTWIVLDLICLTPLITMISLILLSTPSQAFNIYPTAFACIVTSLSSIYLMGYIVKTIKIQAENQALQLQEIYYQELETNQSMIRKLHHDMNSHLGVLAELRKEEPEKADAYLEELLNTQTTNNRIFCSNSLVNAVINSKYNKLLTLEADCFFNIDMENFLSIDDINLCSIFSNTLDNAIEALAKVSKNKRKLSVKARCTNHFFSYEISNYKENEILKKRDKFLSSKPDQAFHGIGLDNIKRIVASYDGTLDISYDDTSFTVTILIGTV